MGSFFGGFLKGLVVGLGSFALGFAALSVLFPVDDSAPPRVEAPVTDTEAPARELPPLTIADHTAPEADSAPEPEAPAVPPEAAEAAAHDGAAEAGNGADAAADAQAERAAPDDAPAAPAVPHVADEALAGGEAGIGALPPAPTAREEGIAGLSALLRPLADDDTALLPAIGALPVDEPVPEAPPAEPPATDPASEEETPGDAAAEPATRPPEDDAAPEGDGTAERIEPGLRRSVEGVVVGRLPSIGTPEAADEAVADAAAEEAESTPELPAYLRHAAAFDNDAGLPLMTVLLLDTVADEAAEAALRALDFPVSIILDPGDEDVARRAALYREAGHEIVLMPIGLPPMATASDIEVNFAAWGEKLPEVVALIDTETGVLRGNIMLARNVLPVLAEDGHGLILHGGGLGGLRRTASGEGVASARVFRSIDDDGENRHRIRRYLDRAVFEAQQNGQVVVIGRAAHEETIAALALWRAEGRAGDVTLAPVSAVLQVQ